MALELITHRVGIVDGKPVLEIDGKVPIRDIGPENISKYEESILEQVWGHSQVSEITGLGPNTSKYLNDIDANLRKIEDKEKNAERTIELRTVMSNLEMVTISYSVAVLFKEVEAKKPDFISLGYEKAAQDPVVGGIIRKFAMDYHTAASNYTQRNRDSFDYILRQMAEDVGVSSHIMIEFLHQACPVQKAPSERRISGRRVSRRSSALSAAKAGVLEDLKVQAGRRRPSTVPEITYPSPAEPQERFEIAPGHVVTSSIRKESSAIDIGSPVQESPSLPELPPAPEVSPKPEDQQGDDEDKKPTPKWGTESATGAAQELADTGSQETLEQVADKDIITEPPREEEMLLSEELLPLGPEKEQSSEPYTEPEEDTEEEPPTRYLAKRPSKRRSRSRYRKKEKKKTGRLRRAAGLIALLGLLGFGGVHTTHTYFPKTHDFLRPVNPAIEKVDSLAQRIINYIIN